MKKVVLQERKQKIPCTAVCNSTDMIVLSSGDERRGPKSVSDHVLFILRIKSFYVVLMHLLQDSHCN